MNLRLGAWMCIGLTIVQLFAALVALYLWGFGIHVPRELGTALSLGPFFTGIPALFLTLERKHR